MFDWNDIRHFIAVADTGSTLAAGHTLRVSQTTVARRITALEEAVGLTLFERRPAGYRLTVSGEALLAHARDVQAAATAFGDAAAGATRAIEGVVRLTVSEIFGVTVLVPILRDLHRDHPGLRMELDTSDEIRDLGTGGADVALRSSAAPTGAGLVGRRICDDAWTVYCSRAYAAAHGQPRSRRDLHGHVLIGGGGGGVWRYYSEWLRANRLEAAVATHYDTPVGLLAAVRAGVGLAVLPSFVAEGDPDLLRCLPPIQPVERGLWLLTHERLRHEPRIRAVLDFLAARLTAIAKRQPVAPV